MGIAEGAGERVCHFCHNESPSVVRRGWIPLGSLCDACWNRLANALAEEEGANAPPTEAMDPDDLTWYEPPRCRDCGARVRRCPTNYDRWVDLGIRELPAKDVPLKYRWRLEEIRPPSSAIVTRVIAVRIRGLEPLPSEPVTPAHVAVCIDPDAIAEVERARAEDLRRGDYGDEAV